MLLVPANVESTQEKQVSCVRDNGMVSMQNQREDKGDETKDDVPNEPTQSTNVNELIDQNPSNAIHNQHVYELNFDQHNENSTVLNQIVLTKLQSSNFLGQRILDSIHSDPLILVPYSALKLLFGNTVLSKSSQLTQGRNLVDKEVVSLTTCRARVTQKVDALLKRKKPPKACVKKTLTTLRKSKKNLPGKRSASPDNRDAEHKTNQSNFGTCAVCGGVCSQYIAYGGRSCTSCRAFFRRSVKRFNR